MIVSEEDAGDGSSPYNRFPKKYRKSHSSLVAIRQSTFEFSSSTAHRRFGGGFSELFLKSFQQRIRIEIIRIDIMRIASYNMIERENTMPKRPREMEKEILDDG